MTVTPETASARQRGAGPRGPRHFLDINRFATAQLREMLEFAHAYKRGEASGWFEPVYEQAAGDDEAIPWARMSAHPVFLDWLEQSPITGLGKNALVIGCGLGDDAEEPTTPIRINLA